MEISVHDNFLLSYFVDAENKEIHLHTKYPYGEEQEQTDVVFVGVAAYHFESDNLMSIVFDVEETTLEATYLKHQALFERLRDYAWPNTRCEDKEELLSSMREQGMKAYEITSSLGLEGFVWARSMVKRKSGN